MSRTAGDRFQLPPGAAAIFGCFFFLTALGCSRERRAGGASTSASSPTVARPQAPVPSVSLRGRGLVFVSNETSNDVSIVDTSSDEVVTTIAVGRRPRGMRLSPDRQRLFVALSGSPRGGPGVDESKLPPPDRKQDGIGVVDLNTLKVAAVLPSGPDPETFDLLPDGNTVLAANEDAATTSIIDVKGSRMVEAIAIGREPEGLAVTPDGRFAYVACEGDDRVDVIDVVRRARIKSIPTGERPRTVIFAKDGKRAFVSLEVAGAVAVIDATKHALVSTISLKSADTEKAKARPMGLALSRDQGTLYVALGRASSVAVIDVEKRSLSNVFVNVGARPWGIALSDDGRKLYTANGAADDISVIDAATGAVLSHVPTGGSPWGVVAGLGP